MRRLSRRFRRRCAAQPEPSGWSVSPTKTSVRSRCWNSGSRRRTEAGDRARPSQAPQLVIDVGDAAEESIFLVVDTGREVERIGARAEPAVAEPQSPEAGDVDWRAGFALELPAEGPGAQAEGVDAAVAEIADQQLAGEIAEAGRGGRQPPGRIQGAAGGDSPEQVPIQVIGIDKSEAWTGLVIVLVRLLHGGGHVEHAVEILDVEGRKPGRDAGIGEGTAQRDHRVAAIEDLDGAEAEVAGVDVVGPVVADREALVNRP